MSDESRNSPVKDAPECSVGLDVVGLLVLFKSFKDQAEICECPRCRSRGHSFAVIVDVGCGTVALHLNRIFHTFGAVSNKRLELTYSVNNLDALRKEPKG